MSKLKIKIGRLRLPAALHALAPAPSATCRLEQRAQPVRHKRVDGPKVCNGQVGVRQRVHVRRRPKLRLRVHLFRPPLHLRRKNARPPPAAAASHVKDDESRCSGGTLTARAQRLRLPRLHRRDQALVGLLDRRRAHAAGARAAPPARARVSASKRAACVGV